MVFLYAFNCLVSLFLLNNQVIYIFNVSIHFVPSLELSHVPESLIANRNHCYTGTSAPRVTVLLLMGE